MPARRARRISVRVDLDQTWPTSASTDSHSSLPSLALIVLAFSLRGVPAPVEPPPGTLEFDAAGAAKSTRDVLALGELARAR